MRILHLKTLPALFYSIVKPEILVEQLKLPLPSDTPSIQRDCYCYH